jgi:hypothetical protein
MTDFGDSEPEDSWHPDDPVDQLVDNLRRRIQLLRFSLGAMATQREQLRLEHLDTDLGFIVERIRNG